MTFVLIGLRRSGNSLLRKDHIKKGRNFHALQALFPPAPQTTPRAETPSGVSQPGTSSSSFSHPSGGQDERGGGVSGCTWCCV